MSYIDLSFDNKSFVKSYRVRGINISDPKWIVPRKDSFPKNASEAPSVLADSEPLSERNELIPIKCGLDETILNLCIFRGGGSIEVDPHVYAGKTKETGFWFQTRCVRSTADEKGGVFTQGQRGKTFKTGGESRTRRTATFTF